MAVQQVDLLLACPDSPINDPVLQPHDRGRVLHIAAQPRSPDALSIVTPNKKLKVLTRTQGPKFQFFLVAYEHPLVTEDMANGGH